MGRHRNPASVKRKIRRIEDQLARERRKDDESRQWSSEPDYHWGTDPGHGGLTKHNGLVADCSSPDAEQCVE